MRINLTKRDLVNLVYMQLGFSKQISENLISVLKKKFNKVKLIKTKTWPLPKSMYKNINLLNKLKKKKIIYFENKYGILTFKTDIYYAQKKN